jgi:type IV pilus assembly protein PilF
MKRFLALLVAGLVAAGCASTAERQAEEAKRRQMIDTNIQLATGYLQNGQVEYAKERLDRALLIDPQDSQANNMMALLQWRLKDYEAADRHFRRALDVDGQNAEAQNNYGVFLCERGRIEEAEAWFKRAIENPYYRTPAIASQNAGLCLSKRGARSAAESYFRTALKLDPRLAPSLHQMATISFESGRALAARGFIQRYFEVAEDSPEVLLLATRIERALKNKDAEASYAMRLRGKFPGSAEAEQLNRMAAGGKR